MSSLDDLLGVARGGDPAPSPEHPQECTGCDKFEVDDIYPRHKYWCWPGDGSVINVTGKKVCALTTREERKQRAEKMRNLRERVQCSIREACHMR